MEITDMNIENNITLNWKSFDAVTEDEWELLNELPFVVVKSDEGITLLTTSLHHARKDGDVELNHITEVAFLPEAVNKELLEQLGYLNRRLSAIEDARSDLRGELDATRGFLEAALPGVVTHEVLPAFMGISKLQDPTSENTRIRGGVCCSVVTRQELLVHLLESLREVAPLVPENFSVH